MRTTTRPAQNETTTEPENDWLSHEEAGAALGLAARTLRKWAAQGKVTRDFGVDGRPRYRRDDVERLKSQMLPHRPKPADSGPPTAGNDTNRADAELALQARKAHDAAARLGEARARERQLQQENAWLRQRVEELQAATRQADQEFRVLLAQSHQLVQQSNRVLEAIGSQQRPALPPAPAPEEKPRRSLLRFWARSG
jgi:hypothetical protein